MCIRPVSLVAIGATVAGILSSPTAAFGCGQERWSVKVLSDGFSPPSTPIVTTIDALRATMRPSVTANSPRLSSEKKTYQVSGTLEVYKMEGDEDYHLVLDSPGNSKHTMIAEIPAKDCAPKSTLGSLWQGLRTELDGKFGSSNGNFITVNKPVTVIGVMFWDIPHATPQRGVAPNNVELHPILALKFGSGPMPSPSAVPSVAPTTMPSAAPTATPTATPGKHGLVKYSTEAEAIAACGSGDQVVWLNTRSGLYHTKSSRWYGKTMKGAYVCRSAADAAGYTFAGE